MPIPGYTKYLIDTEIHCKYCLSENEKGFIKCSTCGETYDPDYKSCIIEFVKKDPNTNERVS